MSAVESILQAYRDGHSALLLSGRSLYDLVVADGKIRPLREVLRRALRTHFGMVFISYSLAAGLDFDSNGIEDTRDRQMIETVLKAHQLNDIPQDQNEVVRVVRGIASLARTPTDGLTWAAGGALRFAFCFEFSEHLTPALNNGTQTDAQLVATELVHITSQSLALRASDNLLLFHGRDGLLDELVCRALQEVRLTQPDLMEKQEFVAAALSLYPEATFDNDLGPEGVAALTKNTPNRGVEVLLRASQRNHRPVSVRELAEQKSRDVELLSEGTLTNLDASRVENLVLFGTNISKPRRILENLGESLLQTNRSMPANVLLAGAPGTAKTDLALLVANRGMAAAYQVLSPKGGIVGETERKARLQQLALKQWTPNIAFIDEVTESLPLQRREFDGDSGASNAVSAALLTALSDESRRGHSVLIATTNRPFAMSAAMRSRFTVIPVLHPLKQDFGGIVLVTARRIDPNCQLQPGDHRIQEAAQIFYEKGANPRHIRGALSNALLLSDHQTLSVDDILFAANDLCACTDLASAIFADLWAIKCCSSRTFLPWSDEPAAYAFPSYLQAVVNPATGEIDEPELNRRIQEYQPYANV